MFNKPPKILAHSSVLNDGNFVLHEYILNKADNTVNLFRRYCPHRLYPLHNITDVVSNINCKFHNFKWDHEGNPINNDKKLKCGTANLGGSGLVSIDFKEPNHRWIEDLAQEKNLEYSHSHQGSSTASWLWLMDAEADLLHLYNGGIHPFLSKQVKLDDIELDQGDGWIIQQHPNGWWLYVYPYTFIEYGRPGMLMVNNVVPNDPADEFGFNWVTQFYYDPNVDVGRRLVFETLENVFKEDVRTCEKQKGKYFPLMESSNKFEDHCVHFGKWVKENLRKEND